MYYRRAVLSIAESVKATLTAFFLFSPPDRKIPLPAYIAGERRDTRMNDPPQNADDRELHDLLIAISVVARHLARRLEAQNRNEEKTHEQDE